MHRKKQLFKYLLSDYLASSVAWLLFNVLRYYEVAVYESFENLTDFLSAPQVWMGQLLMPVFWLTLSYFSGYYNKPVGKSRLTELFSTLLTVVISVVSLFFIIVLNDQPASFHIYYDLFFALGALLFVLTYVPRLMITQQAVGRIARREWVLRLLIIGAGEKALRTAKAMNRQGYTVLGFVSERQGMPVAVDAHLVLGGMEQLPQILDSTPADEVILALSDINANHFTEAGQNIKLCMDKLVSICCLVLLSPLFLYIACRIRRDSGGAVFFRQERIGYRGKPFTIYKFRTMYANAEENGPLLSTGNDPRITPTGSFMRKYRLDELPQFWNVLKGDMSLVGPRPERRFYIDQIVQQAPYYYLLHNLRPGITSLGMVKYGYAANVAQMLERLRYDILYYESLSLLLDLTILIYTVRTVITGKGV